MHCGETTNCGRTKNNELRATLRRAKWRGREFPYQPTAVKTRGGSGINKSSPKSVETSPTTPSEKCRGNGFCAKMSDNCTHNTAVSAATSVPTDRAGGGLTRRRTHSKRLKETL
ncbi:hypothetical protein DdX_08883 [Ditylenchus destructor]|uniref:Uncharacterized protein n=1 Tax=Ditylenchus destructor TaxID=166010 RepID=A0AAD4N1U2_9BILA|nr:hypothetical protein DdX_08883 [Ditylenchus destructor]